MVMKIQVAFLKVVTPWSDVVGYQYFGVPVMLPPSSLYPDDRGSMFF